MPITALKTHVLVIRRVTAVIFRDGWEGYMRWCKQDGCHTGHLPNSGSYWQHSKQVITVTKITTPFLACLPKDPIFLYLPSEISTVRSKKEKAMAPHSSPLAWKIPWTEEPGRLKSMGLWKVGHDWATSLSLFTFTHWRRKWHPLQCSCLENPRDGGARWAAVYGVAQSRTRLKWLSSSSSSSSKV